MSTCTNSERFHCGRLFSCVASIIYQPKTWRPFDAYLTIAVLVMYTRLMSINYIGNRVFDSEKNSRGFIN
jgi:hypothetical protein